MIALAYLRVSGPGQLNGDGFPRQREAIQAYSVANRLTVTGWFEEQVKGTTDWDTRPAWVEMLSALEPGQSIIVERLDRLARDLGVQEFVLRDLKKRRISLISTAEPDLGSTDPTRVLFRQIIGAVAGYERSMIEVKLRHARERKRKQNGRCEGRKPFGGRAHEDTAIALMLELKREGNTTRTIARYLNANLVPTRTGKLWHHGTVAKILKCAPTQIPVRSPHQADVTFFS